MVEQPIRNRQVASSTLALGSRIKECGVSAMPQNSELTIEAVEVSRQSSVCLLLIALLLYNTFLTILGTSRDPSVQHPLSYRATVAGSELRRCTFESTSPIIPPLGVVLFYAALFAPSRETSPSEPRDALGDVTQVVCESSWFRPPPSA